MNSTPSVVTVATLAAFSEAWNRHDVEALMTFMHNDCVFETAAGNEACGARHVGREAVRKAFAAAWASVPDAQWRNGRHVVLGDRRQSGGELDGIVSRVTRRGIEFNRTDDPEALTGKLTDIVAYVANQLAAFGETLKAGDIVVATNRGAQAFGGDAQQLIASRMAERVVDVLEAVEIEDRDAGLPAPIFQEAHQPLLHGSPVG